MLLISTFLFILILCRQPNLSGGNSVRRITDELKEFKIQMKGYSPTKSDEYVAISVKAEPGYIIKFEPIASAERVHHMLLYGCQKPAMSFDFWEGGATCHGTTHILYAWARNAPSLKLPKNVAFSVGNEHDSVRYFVLQVHYTRPFSGNVRDFSGVILHMSNKRPKYLANVLLFVTGQPIPPRQSAFLNNMSCTYNSDVLLHPMAFRVHTHSMGRVVSAYVKHVDRETGVSSWKLIGKRNPQWPQLFQPVENTDLVIQKDDFLAATCRFDSSDKNISIPMGSMGVNEMCNFYMMYYRDANSPDPFPYGGYCSNDQNPELVKREYPADGTTLLPRHIEWEHSAHQSALPFSVTEQSKITSIGNIKLGQVSGLAFDNRDRLIVFHRGSITWNYDTFDASNILSKKLPIEEPTILVAEQDSSGKQLKLIGTYGKSLFYMPHGIFVDKSNHLYTTDVGSHQVIKWEIVNGELHPIWTLGEQFVPGSDTAHFCKPSAVAVSRVDGSVYVADGYCNSRVMKFSKDGQFLTQWGWPSGQDRNFNIGYFNLPHDITLDDFGRVFVTDRENGRVQVFTEQGDPLYIIANPLYYETVYSAHYCDEHGLVFIPGGTSNIAELDAYVVPVNATQVEYAFRPESGKFKRPHVIRVKGSAVWVGEIGEGGGMLWQLKIKEEREEVSGQHSSDHHMLDRKFDEALAYTDEKPSDYKEDRAVSGNFWISIALALIIIFLFYAFCYFCFCRYSPVRIMRGIFCCQEENNAKANIDRKGFRLLQNLDDNEEDESDLEDDFAKSMTR